jgi:poly-gamma-glutamate synthesis protein (capsule biosynthesis protein)
MAVRRWVRQPFEVTGGSVLLLGDVRLAKVADPEEPFGRLHELLEGDDLVFGNLEGAFHDGIDPYEYYAKKFWTHAGTAGAPALQHGNFAAVGLANNVIIGEAAINETIARLDEMGIAHTGAGPDLQSARAPAILERDGVTYGFLARTSIFWPFAHRAVPGGRVRMPTSKRYMQGFYEPGAVVEFYPGAGVATIRPHTAYEPSFTSIYEGGGDALIHTWPDEAELEEFVEDVRALRERVDVLVTSHHWRVRGSDVVRDYRIEIAHAAVDAGADLVLGHGSHFVEPVEIYRDKPIFYGIGECFFRWSEDRQNHHAGIGNLNLAVKVHVEDGSIGRVECFVLGPATANGDVLEVKHPERDDIADPSDTIDAIGVSGLVDLVEASARVGAVLEIEEDHLVLR